VAKFPVSFPFLGEHKGWGCERNGEGRESKADSHFFIHMMAQRSDVFVGAKETHSVDEQLATQLQT
jgi:hypothetical protein